MDEVPLWQPLAVSLGVPITKAKALQQADPTLGGFEALKLWQSGRYTDKGLPPTWACLLTAVAELKAAGPRVSERIAQRASMKKNWSIDPTGTALCKHVLMAFVHWGMVDLYVPCTGKFLE